MRYHEWKWFYTILSIVQILGFIVSSYLLRHRLFSNLYQSGVSIIFSQELYQTGTYFPKTYNSMKDKISTKSKITFLKNIVRCPVFILLRFLFYSTPLCTTTHMWMHVCHIELLKQGEFHRSRIETWKKRNLQ